MRERRPGYTITIVPVIIGVLGGGMKKTTNELTKLLAKHELVCKTAAEMQKTILMDSETFFSGIVLSGIVQVTQKRTSNRDSVHFMNHVVALVTSKYW